MNVAMRERRRFLRADDVRDRLTAPPPLEPQQEGEMSAMSYDTKVETAIERGFLIGKRNVVIEARSGAKRSPAPSERRRCR